MFSRDQVLALMRERVHHPASMRELLQVLKVPKDDQTSFKRQVKSLVSSGELIQIRGNRFGLPEKMDLYVGRLQTNPAGYGFVTPERPLEPSGGDIYIPNKRSTKRCTATVSWSASNGSRTAAGRKGASSASSSAAPDRWSAATIATTPGWDT